MGHILIYYTRAYYNGESVVDRVEVVNYFQDSVKSNYKLEQIRFADGTTWDIATINAMAISGTNQGDSLQGYDSNDTLNGFEGADYLYGLDGNDVLDGGVDNVSDYLDGGNGSDTYLFNPGWGNDVIQSFDETINKTDVIQFGPGITPADIRVSALNGDLILSRAGTTDNITISSYFNGTYTGNFTGQFKIDQVKFADGTVWDQATLEAKARVASNSDDWLFGVDTADTIDGLAGNDTLYGLSGNDILIGNAGNDSLEGGLGSDTYIFERGWGQDTVVNLNEVGTTDTIQFGTGITAADIQFSRTYNSLKGNYSDLTLLLVGTTDKITLSYFWDSHPAFMDQLYDIDKVQFADGTVWDIDQIKARSLLGHDGDDILSGFDTNDVITGQAGNDEIYGGNGDDIINGGSGNDILSGGDGSDTYQFDRGWGQDEIYAWSWGTNSSDIDVIQFAPDISPGDIQVRRHVDFPDDLVITLIGTSNTIRVTDYFYLDDPANIGIDEIRFANGTVWNLDTVINMTNNVDHNTAETLVGSAYDDILDGLGGNDTLFGLDGNDTLIGGDGNDNLDGGNGIDTILGGTGNDTYIADSPLDSITENPNEGTDTV